MTWIRLAGILLGAITAIPCQARDYTGQSDEMIRGLVGAEFRALGAELLPTCSDRQSTLDAVLQLVKTRNEIFESLGEVRSLTAIDGIMLADALDDSLIYPLGDLLAAYVEEYQDPVINPGTEQFHNQMANLGFVNALATGFLVHLELEQALRILAEFYQVRSDAEVEAAQDALLRHFDTLAKLFRSQHISLQDMHACNMANLDWAIGRIRSESGASDFTESGRLFAHRADGQFAYRITLVSPSTGETMQIDYLLPHLTALDEGPSR